jgi:hypothetical protein
VVGGLDVVDAVREGDVIERAEVRPADRTGAGEPLPSDTH